MDKNLKTPENIDKLIERQASNPSYLDGKFPPVSSNGGVSKDTENNKVYKKVKCNINKKGK